MLELSFIEKASQALKSASTIINELSRLKISSEVSSKVTEMNAEIISAQGYTLSAQQRQMELINRVSELEKEVMSLKEWDTKKDDYELKSIQGTAFAYAMKETVETSEPPHWLCQPCFENRKKSVLQKQGPGHGEHKPTWRCPVCKAEIRVSYNIHP